MFHFPDLFLLKRMFQKSFVELRKTFVELRVIFNGLFYTKLHEECTKLHEVILDKSYLLRQSLESCSNSFSLKILLICRLIFCLEELNSSAI